MTMLPARTGVANTFPNPPNSLARTSIGQEWDVLHEMNEAAEIDVAAASTVDIGGQTSQKIRLTGSGVTINSLGTNYRGPIKIRVAGVLTIVNGSGIVCAGGGNIVTAAGDSLETWPKATGGTTDGWFITTVGKVTASAIPAGVVMAFFQAAAPVGWTQVTAHDNKALRIVGGTGGGSGGSVAFTSAFTSQAVVGSNSATTLTTAQIPAHTHTGGYQPGGQNTGSSSPPAIAAQGTTLTGTQTGTTGQAHNHTFTGTAINLAVQYIDMILASKN